MSTVLRTLVYICLYYIPTIAQYLLLSSLQRDRRLRLLFTTIHDGRDRVFPLVVNNNNNDDDNSLNNNIIIKLVAGNPHCPSKKWPGQYKHYLLKTRRLRFFLKTSSDDDT